MRGIFLAHQAAGQQRESGLHEEDQVAGVQRPGEVRGDAKVARPSRRASPPAVLSRPAPGSRRRLSCSAHSRVRFCPSGSATTKGLPPASVVAPRSPVAMPAGSGLGASSARAATGRAASMAASKKMIRKNRLHAGRRSDGFIMRWLLKECGVPNSSEALLLEQAWHIGVAGRHCKLCSGKGMKSGDESPAQRKLLFTVNARLRRSPIEISFCGHQKRRERRMHRLPSSGSRTRENRLAGIARSGTCKNWILS